LVDGVVLTDALLGRWRRSVAHVPQSIFLADDSVSANIALPADDQPFNSEAVLRSAEAAQLAEFIESLPDGFDTKVGERGARLSGGQRQRLAIARAIYKDAPLLVLDEATSALDAVTEAKLNAALDEVMKGRTTFVIAHRLSTIRNATRILLFESGRVIESGTFDELVAKGGRFAELARAQFMVQGNAQVTSEKSGTAVKV